MAVDTGKKPGTFRVVIVGGSIAGLTLAHALARAGIDYVILEARDDMAPRLGASIGIFSNGARILDQLGIFDTIEQHVDSLKYSQSWTGKGDLVFAGDAVSLLYPRTGYPISVVDRQKILRAMYDHLPDKSKALTGKKVTAVERLPDGVKVHCQDGTTFSGDIVAGADGVHSRIRHEMWRHAEIDGKIKEFESDRKAMSCEYRCLFGISTPVPGISSLTMMRCFNERWSFLLFIGKDDECFWFAFEKLDKKYQPPNIPRYTEADQLEFIKPFMSRHVTDNVRFSDLWERRTASTLTALEEARYQHWTYGRMVCLGDAIHKITPNAGLGGNMAMESAAVLSNTLHDMVRSKSQPKEADIQAAFKEYVRIRKPRADYLCKSAGSSTRLEALDRPIHKAILHAVVPRAGDTFVDVVTGLVAGAPKIEFLPPPERSIGVGTIYRAIHSGTKLESSLGKRALLALPLLALAWSAYSCLAANQSASPFFPPLDKMSTAVKLDSFSLLGDLVPLQVITLIECARRGNSLALIAFWTFFAVFVRVKDIGYVMPAYFFAHYVQCSLNRYMTPDKRMVPTNYAETTLPAVAIAWLFCVGAFSFSDSVSGAGDILQLFPLCVVGLQQALTYVVTDTTAEDRLSNTEADMKHLWPAYLGSAVFSAVIYLYTWAASGTSLLTNLQEALLLAKEIVGQSSGELVSDNMIKYNHWIAAGAGLLWALLHFKDLRDVGRSDASLAVVGLGLIATTCLLGPGAAIALGWAWRESVLAQPPPI